MAQVPKINHKIKTDLYFLPNTRSTPLAVFNQYTHKLLISGSISGEDGYTFQSQLLSQVASARVRSNDLQVDFKLNALDIGGVGVVIRILKYLSQKYDQLTVNWFSQRQDMYSREVADLIAELSETSLQHFKIPALNLGVAG